MQINSSAQAEDNLEKELDRTRSGDLVDINREIPVYVLSGSGPKDINTIEPEVLASSCVHSCLLLHLEPASLNIARNNGFIDARPVHH